MTRSLLFVFLVAFLALPALSFAQQCPDPNVDPNNASPQICITDPTGGQTFEQILGEIIRWLTLILGPILVIILVIGAFQMLTARDNEAQFSKGKKTVTYAIIGAAVILLANGVLYVIRSFLDVN